MFDDSATVGVMKISRPPSAGTIVIGSMPAGLLSSTVLGLSVLTRIGWEKRTAIMTSAGTSRSPSRGSEPET